MPIIAAAPDSQVTGSRLSLRAPSRAGSSLSLKAPSRSGSKLSVRETEGSRSGSRLSLKVASRASSRQSTRSGKTAGGETARSQRSQRSHTSHRSQSIAGPDTDSILAKVADTAAEVAG